MFLQAAGLKGQTEVPYKGAGPTLIDLMGGRLDFTFDGFGSSRSYIESGKTRALAVTGATRMQPLPDVPTFQEAGFNFTYRVWHVLVVPAGTPKAAIQRLSEALKYALEQKDIVERWRSEGSDATFLTPEETTEFLRQGLCDQCEAGSRSELREAVRTKHPCAVEMGGDDARS